jgi:hypothetical protein
MAEKITNVSNAVGAGITDLVFSIGPLIESAFEDDYSGDYAAANRSNQRSNQNNNGTQDSSQSNRVISMKVTNLQPEFKEALKRTSNTSNYDYEDDSSNAVTPNPNANSDEQSALMDNSEIDPLTGMKVAAASRKSIVYVSDDSTKNSALPYNSSTPGTASNATKVFGDMFDDATSNSSINSSAAFLDDPPPNEYKKTG